MSQYNETTDLTDFEFNRVLAASSLTVPDGVRAQLLINVNQLRLMVARLQAFDLPGDPEAGAE